MNITRMFKRTNLLGLDFYVDWVAETGEFISIKEVHSGRIFVYKGLKNESGESVEDMFRNAVGAYKPQPVKKEEPKKEEVKEEVKVEVAPAALETEQPKEELNAKKAKTGNRKLKK